MAVLNPAWRPLAALRTTGEARMHHPAGVEAPRTGSPAAPAGDPGAADVQYWLSIHDEADLITPYVLADLVRSPDSSTE